MVLQRAKSTKVAKHELKADPMARSPQRGMTNDRRSADARRAAGKLEKREYKQMRKIRLRTQGDVADTREGQASLRSIVTALFIVFALMYALFLFLENIADSEVNTPPASGPSTQA